MSNVSKCYFNNTSLWMILSMITVVEMVTLIECDLNYVKFLESINQDAVNLFKNRAYIMSCGLHLNLLGLPLIP